MLLHMVLALGVVAVVARSRLLGTTATTRSCLKHVEIIFDNIIVASSWYLLSKLLQDDVCNCSVRYNDVQSNRCFTTISAESAASIFSRFL